MLYTVIPLERVYHNFREENGPTIKDKTKEKSLEENSEYKEVQLKHGRIVTRRDGDNYVIQKVNSTDMGDYLNSEYAPGNPYRNNE